MVFGKRCFFLYTVAPDGSVWWGANPPRHDEPAPGELAALRPDEWRAQLLELFARDRGPMAAIIRSTPDEHFARAWPTYDLPTVRTWSRDRMIVIGDAAHATSPSSGQGASMAIEDGVELARCLRDLPVDAAFRAFEGLRRERVEAVVAQGARTSGYKAAGPLARVLRDAVMPIFLRRAAGRGAASVTRLHDYSIDWDAPVAQAR
jgi:FAD-dependent urate hydroxylase